MLLLVQNVLNLNTLLLLDVLVSIFLHLVVVSQLTDLVNEPSVLLHNGLIFILSSQFR
jgi:hypothetical protein